MSHFKFLMLLRRLCFYSLAIYIINIPKISATNSVMIQGSSDWLPDFYMLSKGLNKELMFIGMTLAEISQIKNTPIKSGPWSGQDAIFNTLPDDDLNIKLLRFGFRGHNTTNNVDYLLLLESGDNLQTELSDKNIFPAEWSMTVNKFPGTRMRIGQFRYPGSEEGMKWTIAQHYTQYPLAVNILLLERYFDNNGTNTLDANKMNGPVSGFTDMGIQVFDQINRDNLDHTYALMIGLGNGPNRSDNNSNKDVYMYYSIEQLFGGFGYQVHNIKFYSWLQHGERKLKYFDDVNYTRNRYGFGFQYRKKRWRIESEYIKADGMVFAGTDGGAIPGSLSNNKYLIASNNILVNGKGDGWHLDIGYYVTPDLIISARPEELNVYDDINYNIKHKTTTLGSEYRINDNMIVVLNYEFRDLTAPALESSSIENQILSGVDNKLTLQFKLSGLW